MIEYKMVLDDKIYSQLNAILVKHHKNLNDVIELYLNTLIKDPSILEIIEKKSKPNFIGILDKEIGDIDYKKEKNENFS